MRLKPGTRSFSLALLAAAVLAAGCRKDDRAAAPAEDRIAVLERALERQRDAEALVADVEAWIVRVSSIPVASERDRAESTARSLRERLARLKPALERKGADRREDAALNRELADLANAFDRAVASMASERRGAEDAMAAAMTEIGDQLTAYRVELASAGVQGNAEARRRTAQLELARRAANQTLAEMRRARPEQWAWLHRRWLAEVHDFRDDLRQARERAMVMTPEPSPTPAMPASKKFPPKVSGAANQ
jgi:hypothetical protein